MAYVFPDTANLPRAESDPSEPLYSGTVGSNRIFHTLRVTAGLQGHPRWNLYLINVYTLARNAYASTKGITAKKLDDAVDHDADLYMTFIGAYTNFNRPTPSVVVFYAPDYSVIPEPLRRVHTGQRVEFDAMYAAMRSKLPTKLTELTEDPLTQKFLVAVGGSRFPHRQLPELIRHIYGGRRSYGAIGTVMISHCPLDLHLYQMIPKLELLESHTAGVYPVAEFGRKLTKEVKVPFNTITHRIFGDEIHLAPLLKGKQKTALIELADAKSWSIRTESEIITDITKTFPEVTRTSLTSLRL